MNATCESWAPPINLKSSLKDGRVVSEASLAEIAAVVSQGRVVILKGVFDSQLMLEYREALMRWARNNPPFPHGSSPSEFPEINYHRIDDGVVRSVCPHIFHQFGFNSINNLEDRAADLSTQIAEPMRFLQNEIAGTNFCFSLAGLRLKILHYPSGGGFLSEHSHPLEPQRVGLIASMSRIGEDVTTGATCFRTPDGRVDTTTTHDIGDLIVFRYDLPHEVTPVDEEGSLDWASHSGKWSVVLELRDTHALSHRAQPGTESS